MALAGQRLIATLPVGQVRGSEVLAYRARLGGALPVHAMFRHSPLVSFQVYQDPFSFDTHFEALLDDSVIELVATTRHVELPAVPRTSNDLAFKCPLAEWPALMRTDPVQRVTIPVDVE
jgi:hypothetical protein